MSVIARRAARPCDTGFTTMYSKHPHCASFGLPSRYFAYRVRLGTPSSPYVEAAMPEYRFQMIIGSSKPSRGLTARDDADAFDVMKRMVKKEGGTYVQESMTTSENGRNFRKVPDPNPLQADDASRYLASLSDEERRPIDLLTQGGSLRSSPESFSDEERAAAEKIFEVPEEGLGRFSR